MPEYNPIKFETSKQVYAPAEDTFLLADKFNSPCRRSGIGNMNWN